MLLTVIKLNRPHAGAPQNLPLFEPYHECRHAVGTPFEETQMRQFAVLAAAALCALSLSASASAKMMSCSGDNMSKTGTMMMSMPDGPSKMAMNKEMGMANMEASKGNMKGACMHYMRAQKMGMMKSEGMMSPGMKM